MVMRFRGTMEGTKLTFIIAVNHHERKKQKENEITLENELSNAGDNITMSVLVATQSVLLHMIFSNNDNDC